MLVVSPLKALITNKTSWLESINVSVAEGMPIMPMWNVQGIAYYTHNYLQYHI